MRCMRDEARAGELKQMRVSL
ncbi:Protein of unknown function [Thermobacillus xylanilyticus]|uniref:Uncharacterized protein n=1 Tax=Thermobacillus xylanilyticus TaxID=76633 RepID=A0ABN7S384_THEXY|nr:Protein of unknown function [Thermobacillus xylanilyticus]